MQAVHGQASAHGRHRPAHFAPDRSPNHGPLSAFKLLKPRVFNSAARSAVVDLLRCVPKATRMHMFDPLRRDEPAPAVAFVKLASLLRRTWALALTRFTAARNKRRTLQLQLMRDVVKCMPVPHSAAALQPHIAEMWINQQRLARGPEGCGDLPRFARDAPALYGARSRVPRRRAPLRCTA